MQNQLLRKVGLETEFVGKFDWMKVESEEERLKYLEFVQVAAFSAVVYFSRLYGYAKENSGPLKPGVQSVEGTVKTIVGPVYNRFHDVPIELLKFVDRKVKQWLFELCLSSLLLLPLDIKNLTRFNNSSYVQAIPSI